MEPDATAIPFSALRFVTLRLLWDCNLRCIMCDHPHKPRLEMAVETANKTLDQIPHPVRLAFIGGEPCLWLLRHPGVMRRAIEAGHYVHLTTNGILLPRLTDFVDAFADRPVSVQFSIDGFGENYERIRPPGRWRNVVTAIRLIHQRRQSSGNRDARIIVGSLLMRQTLDDLSQLIEFCANEGVDAVTLTYAVIYDSMVARGTIDENDSVFHHQEAVNEAISRARATAQRCGVALSYPPYLGDTTGVGGRRWEGKDPANLPPGRFPKPQGLACTRPWNEIFVNQDGRIVPCCCGTSIGPTVGHIDDSLETIWRGSRIQEVRGALLSHGFDSACRCGANMAVGGKSASPEHFLTRRREEVGSSLLHWTKDSPGT